MFICHLSSSIKFYWTLIFNLATKMKRCLSFYFVIHEDELGSSFAFISAQIAKGYWGIIKIYPDFLHSGVTLL
ncbi:hypothetical protein GQ55_6G068400 [Panicum hallii var. hallii]|uniref:Uncharacterized protein n=1 Tax=Panicum hallii var. hallii TaxID=1504633 RepID=A0A2T7D4R4_9POAL|nr:hypothetical protein GQ55_6G068400 [Panicum hallii var. hallii]